MLGLVMMQAVKDPTKHPEERQADGAVQRVGHRTMGLLAAG